MTRPFTTPAPGWVQPWVPANPPLPLQLAPWPSGPGRWAPMPATRRPPRISTPAWAVIGLLCALLFTAFFWGLGEHRRHSAGTTPEMQARVQELIAATESARGQSFSTPVRVTVLTPEEVRARLTREPDSSKGEGAVIEGRRLALLGLIPPDAAGTFAAQSSGAYNQGVAGYFDPRTKELVVTLSPGGIDSHAEHVIVHELTHALTDQVFGSRPPDSVLKGGQEAYSAWLAVIEGDAELTAQREAEAAGRPPDATDSWKVHSAGPYQFVLDAFRYPYDEGMPFVQAVYDKGGWPAVNELYRNPPATTEQILHPEKYFAHEQARRVDLPDPDLGQGWESVDGDDFGELALRGMLRVALPDDDAARFATGWGGGSFKQWQRGGSTLVVVRIVGDDANLGASIEAGLGSYLQHWSRTGAGTARLGRAGDTVTMVFSTDQAALTQAATGLGL